MYFNTVVALQGTGVLVPETAVPAGRYAGYWRIMVAPTDATELSRSLHHWLVYVQQTAQVEILLSSFWWRGKRREQEPNSKFCHWTSAKTHVLSSLRSRVRRGRLQLRDFDTQYTRGLDLQCYATTLTAGSLCAWPWMLLEDGTFTRTWERFDLKFCIEVSTGIQPVGGTKLSIISGLGEW